MKTRDELFAEMADEYLYLSIASDTQAVVIRERIDALQLEIDNIPDALFADWDIDDMEAEGSDTSMRGQLAEAGFGDGGVL